MRTIYILGILVLLAVVVPAAPAQAGGVVSVCDEAHLLAALAGGGTVTFACSGTITLTAEIVIAADTTIDGSGQTVIISGNNAVRVFVVNEGVTLNLNRLTVADGYVHSNDDDGGGIYNLGTLIVTNCTFSNNASTCDRYCGGDGGGIYNLGTLTVTNSRFSDNYATCDQYCSADGGGIYNLGTLTVTNSTFSNNASICDRYCDGGGGGIANSGTLTVTNSTFSNNASACEYCPGGGIANGGTLILVGSIFSGNSAYEGGGIGSGGTLTVSSSTFFDNDAAYGGGIHNGYGTLTISGSTFSDNHAVASGGGIRTTHGHANVSNSTFVGNSASLYGGGISDDYGTVAVTNTTFSGNIAYNGGGGINASLPSGYTFTLKNAIVANSPEGENCAGTITDGGGNLSYPDTTCPGINADSLLGPLQDNGGPTWTMALGEGSAALDAANDVICAAPPVNNLDQRGVTRPQGLHCDIGAFEQIQEPSAVSVSALRAQSLPGTITPAMIAGLLLLVLVVVGVQWRPRHIG